MFGNSKRLPITLALRGCRPAVMTDNRSVQVTRWGNGPAAAQAARSLSRLVCATTVVPHTDGVIITGVEACPLQASSRDDHEALCRNRRVFE